MQKDFLFAPGGSSITITALESGYINTSFTVKNTHASKSQDVTMIVVLKEGDTIKQFQFEKGTLAVNDTLTFNGGFLIGNAENHSIETYVWDSLYGMTPLTAEHTLTTSGRTSGTTIE